MICVVKGLVQKTKGTVPSLDSSSGESDIRSSCLNAEAEALAFGVHAAVAAFFLDGERGQIANNEQRNDSHPADDDHCKGV